MSDSFDAYLAARRNRGFGDILAVSGQAEFRAVAGLHAGAQNLVNKALVALEEGDEDRALRYVTRAAHLPWDDVEQHWPGALAAHLALFEEVSEARETASDGDTSWVDDAVTVLGELTGEPHDHLAQTLGVFGWDPTIELTPAEARKIRRAVGSERVDSDFGSDPSEAPEQLAPRMLDILRATNRYHLVHVHGQ